MPNTSSPNSRIFFSVTAWNQRLVFWFGAVLVGLVIVAITQLSEWAARLFRMYVSPTPWLAFAIAPLGLALTSWISYRFFPGAERSGIPQIKTALAMSANLERRARLMSLRIALGKILLPIMGLLSGASVGLGGPSVHVGASIMTSLGRAVRFPPHYQEKGLILAGSAAGFAAMFSAPLTGIVFAIEEMGRALEEKISSLVLTAIIFAGITAYAFLDNYIFFEDKSLVMPWGWTWAAIPLCGIVGGLFGAIFSLIIIKAGNWMDRSPIPKVLLAMGCGLLVALCGYLSDGATFGTGYATTESILYGTHEHSPWFAPLKMLATCATYLSGIPSGIFVPALAIGAGLGENLSEWAPLAPATAMILLAMSAYFAGMLQSPITAFSIVMETTSSQEILIPLMATAFIATATSKLLCPVPLYRALSETYADPAPARDEPSPSEDAP